MSPLFTIAPLHQGSIYVAIAEIAGDIIEFLLPVPGMHPEGEVLDIADEHYGVFSFVIHGGEWHLHESAHVWAGSEPGQVSA